jgi:acyl-CoA thioesterase FadM
LFKTGDAAMFLYQTSVRLYDVDGANRLFFGAQFRLIHNAWEAFLNDIGMTVQDIILTADYAIPVVHAHADYFAALGVGAQVVINVSVTKIGDSSFTIAYHLSNDEKGTVGYVETVQVCVDKKKGEKIPVPDDLRKKLKKHLADAKP